MSRLPLPEQPTTVPHPPEMILLMEQLDKSPITAANIRTWTNTDPVMSQVRQFVLCYVSGWLSNVSDETMKPYFSRQTELSVQDGCILWGNRVIISQAGQFEVLQLHEANTYEAIGKNVVWWPGLDPRHRRESKRMC